MNSCEKIPIYARCFALIFHCIRIDIACSGGKNRLKFKREVILAGGISKTNVHNIKNSIVQNMQILFHFQVQVQVQLILFKTFRNGLSFH